MHALLMANAPFVSEAEPYLREALAQAQLLVGVDGGARALLRLGLIPDVVTGDGDSLTDAEREALRESGAQLIPTPDQDYTDLDKALSWLREQSATQITVFGATGGRLDHTYSGLSALLKHAQHLPIKFIDETARYERVTEHWECQEPNLIGRTLSLLAFSRVEGVTTKGVRWPLTKEWLAPGQRDGTLNEVTEERVQISVDAGELIVMLHHT